MDAETDPGIVLRLKPKLSESLDVVIECGLNQKVVLQSMRSRSVLMVCAISNNRAPYTCCVPEWSLDFTSRRHSTAVLAEHCWTGERGHVATRCVFVRLLGVAHTVL